jgi:hypothetical protein
MPPKTQSLLPDPTTRPTPPLRQSSQVTAQQSIRQAQRRFKQTFQARRRRSLTGTRRRRLKK